MQRIETSLPDVFDWRPVIHRDTRGFFIEIYHKAKFADLGIADDFVTHKQDSAVSSKAKR
jgi:dTDP-4-dehydrorhamnose 3,5-epimerase